jgi:hypothetical protein
VLEGYNNVLGAKKTFFRIDTDQWTPNSCFYVN